MKYFALLRRLLAPAQPAVDPVVPIVHRGEREMSIGAACLGRPSPAPAKLSAAEALRCFGVEQGGA